MLLSRVYDRLRRLLNDSAASRRALDSLVLSSANQQASLGETIRTLTKGFTDQQSMLAQLIEVNDRLRRELAGITEDLKSPLGQFAAEPTSTVFDTQGHKLLIDGFETIPHFLNEDEAAELRAVVDEVYD